MNFRGSLGALLEMYFDEKTVPMVGFTRLRVVVRHLAWQCT